ncbi:MAG: hypothetical protein ACJAYY_001027 [Paraglaciecola sp.]
MNLQQKQMYDTYKKHKKHKKYQYNLQCFVNKFNYFWGIEIKNGEHNLNKITSQLKATSESWKSY